MISAILNDGTSRMLLRKIIQDKCMMITSEQIINELEQVLSRPKFKMSRGEIKKIIDTIV